MYPESRIQNLKDRAYMLSQVRSFFRSKNVLEVDTPLLSHSAPIDEHIDIMSVDLQNTKGYLHSSPEYAMKRLLSLGIGDIFQLSHVFRLGEIGRLHNPEFTMIEWYRTRLSFETFIEETVSLIQLFLGPYPYKHISYREAFRKYAHIDYVHASVQDLLQCATSHGIDLSSPSSWDFDALLQLLMGSVIEPHLGQEEITVLGDYPSSQAALAKTEQKGDEKVAKRFEIYFQGIELANGYLELTDGKEQRTRFLQSNEKRQKAGKESLPIDEHFLEALEKGFPECCGVAVGFDRLLMLKQKASSLKEILPFSWDEI
ncbi:MAG: EF-P lysine aminoacylase GenX [Rhabdochlamydiaceae bacterium]|nr:EF-P lysine aminoacylase GenX [Rhabdochlamydiaceae bacterium]